MLVEEIMKREVISLPPNATIAEAYQILQDNPIRHIPIVNEDEELIGIVSDRDVRDASPSILSKEMGLSEMNHSIDTIMTTPVITIHPLDFVEEVASIFYEREIACLPVVQKNKLIGMVTEKDMLYTLIQLTGTHVQSSQVEIKVPNRAGILPEVAAIFGHRKVNIASVLVYPYKNDSSFKILVFRIQTMNPLPIIEDIQQAGYEVLWPNMGMTP
ncbi:acetoin utilization AcuB family protein [Radiobacillus kanasensis]|uniref:acetoin utilization AcuB family protein n=1 Tax=Radiobacillus kanasensis TaxID=2844358 RepID=UPI001E418617|nr:acetoin utilization AcuB family protein [Radiobacillus kanasensis]UFT98057.1 acetoin utilization AcuB family protein [Radiobacillus kanasensis]